MMTLPTSETSSIFRSPARKSPFRLSTPKTSRPTSPFIDITTPPHPNTVAKKVGVVEIDNPPAPQQPQKDATDDLIVNILPNTHTHTHTQQTL